MASRFKSITSLKAKYDQAVSSRGREALEEHFKKFFDEYPEIAEVTWTQYTPYFNDGDACTFRVNDFQVKAGDSDKLPGGWRACGEEIEPDITRSRVDTKMVYKGTRAAKRAYKDFCHLLNIPNDILEAVFGDHVQVTATRKGFEVDEYNHE